MIIESFLILEMFSLLFMLLKWASEQRFTRSDFFLGERYINKNLHCLSVLKRW